MILPVKHALYIALTAFSLTTVSAAAAYCQTVQPKLTIKASASPQMLEELLRRSLELERSLMQQPLMDSGLAVSSRAPRN